MNKKGLKKLSDKTFFDNADWAITPANQRAFNEELIDSVTLQKETDELQKALRNETRARQKADEALGERIDNLDAETAGTIEVINEAIDLLREELGSEAEARETADNALGERIDTLSTETSEALASLREDLETEVSTRENADIVLGGRIDTLASETNSKFGEVNAAIGQLGDDLDAETEARENADIVLGGRIDTLASETNSKFGEVNAAIGQLGDDLDTETEARENADTALGGRIDTLASETNSKFGEVNSAIGQLGDNLDAETEARENADIVLGGRIDTLASETNSKFGEVNSVIKQLGDNLDAETEARENADTALGGRIDTLASETNSKFGEVNSVIKQLGDNLDAETEARENADTALGGRIDTLASETNSKFGEVNSAIGQLGDNLDAETEARENADTALGGRIDTLASETNSKFGEVNSAIDQLGDDLDAETEARENADTALGSRIDSLSTETSVSLSSLHDDLAREAEVRESADNDLNSRINELTTDTSGTFDDVNGALDSLRDDLNTEAGTRESADTALSNRVDALKIEVNRKIEDAVTEVVYDADEAILTISYENQPSKEINLPKENFLSEAEFYPETNILELTLVDGYTFSVNMTELVDIYTAGNGLVESGNQFSIQLDSTSENYLVVSGNGIKVTGIDAALNTLSDRIDSLDTETSGDIDDINSALGALRDDLETETESRQNADVALGSRIDTLVSNTDDKFDEVNSALDLLGNNLETETEARQNADIALEGRINTILNNKQDKLIAGDNITITDNLISSLVPEEYAKKTDVDEKISGIEIGGTNLLDGTYDGYGWKNKTAASSTLTVQDGLFHQSSTRTDVNSRFYSPFVYFNPEKQYTISFKYRTVGESNTGNCQIYIISQNEDGISASINKIFQNKEEWTEFKWTFGPLSAWTEDTSYVRFDSNIGGTTSGSFDFYVKDIKLEEGTFATTYNLSVADIQRIDGRFEDYLPLTGGTIDGKIYMNRNKIHLGRYPEGLSGVSYVPEEGVLLTGSNAGAESGSNNITIATNSNGNINLNAAGKVLYNEKEVAIQEDVLVLAENIDEVSGKIDSIQIGGTNLLNGTYDGLNWVLNSSTKANLSIEKAVFTIKSTTTSVRYAISNNIAFEKGKEYTISLKYKVDSLDGNNVDYNYIRIAPSDSTSDLITYQEVYDSERVGEWIEFSATFTPNDTWETGEFRVFLYNTGSNSTTNPFVIEYKEVKLEEGNRKTSYNHSVKDVANITANSGAVNPNLTDGTSTPIEVIGGNINNQTKSLYHVNSKRRLCDIVPDIRYVSVSFDWELTGRDTIVNENAKIQLQSHGINEDGEMVYGAFATDFLDAGGESGHFTDIYQVRDSSNTPYNNIYFANRIYVRFNYIPDTVTLKIFNFKIEYGTRVTRWCRSIPDIENLFADLAIETESRQNADIAIGSRIDAALEDKQDKLTAGDNIEIENNVIRSFIPEEYAKKADVDEKISAIEIGGTNLLPGTYDGVGWKLNQTSTSSLSVEKGIFEFYTTVTSQTYLDTQYVTVTPERQYTISFWYKTEGNPRLPYFRVYLINEGGNLNVNVPNSEDWTTFNHTFTIPEDWTEQILVRFYNYGIVDNAGEDYNTNFLRNINFEIGNVATDWNQSQEDVNRIVETIEVKNLLQKTYIEKVFKGTGSASRVVGMYNFLDEKRLGDLVPNPGYFTIAFSYKIFNYENLGSDAIIRPYLRGTNEEGTSVANYFIENLYNKGESGDLSVVVNYSNNAGAPFFNRVNLQFYNIPSPVYIVFSNFRIIEGVYDKVWTPIINDTQDLYNVTHPNKNYLLGTSQPVAAAGTSQTLQTVATYLFEGNKTAGDLGISGKLVTLSFDYIVEGVISTPEEASRMSIVAYKGTTISNFFTDVYIVETGTFHISAPLEQGIFDNNEGLSIVYRNVPPEITITVFNVKFEIGGQETVWTLNPTEIVTQGDIAEFPLKIKEETEARQDADIALGSRIDALITEVNKKIEEAVTDIVYDADEATLVISYENSPSKNINLPKENFLSAAEYDPATNRLELSLVDGSSFSVDMKDLVDIYTAGNGLSESGNQFSIKVDSASEDYLSVSGNGIKITGIDAALDGYLPLEGGTLTGNISLEGGTITPRFSPNAIFTDADLNDYTSPGFWICQYNATAATLSNSPTVYGFGLEVIRVYASTTNVPIAPIRQFLYEQAAGGGRIFTRIMSTTQVWSNWVEIYTTGTFDPSKYLSLSGGTLTGNVTIGTSTNYANLYVKNNAFIGSVTNSANGQTGVILNGDFGLIELIGSAPKIDFHFENSTADFTSRIIEVAEGTLSLPNKLIVGSTSTSYSDYAFTAIGNSYLGSPVNFANKLNVDDSGVLRFNATGSGAIAMNSNKIYLGGYSDPEAASAGLQYTANTGVVLTGANASTRLGNSIIIAPHVTTNTTIAGNIELNTSANGVANYNGNEIATVDQLVSYLPLSGGIMTGSLAMNSQKLRLTTMSSNDNAGLQYIFGTGIVLSGAKASSAGNGNIILDTANSGSAYPGNILLKVPEGATAQYNGNEIATVNNLSSYLPLSGGTLTGNLVLNYNVLNLGVVDGNARLYFNTNTGVFLESAEGARSADITLHTKLSGNLNLNTTDGKALYNGEEIATGADLTDALASYAKTEEVDEKINPIKEITYNLDVVNPNLVDGSSIERVRIGNNTINQDVHIYWINNRTRIIELIPDINHLSLSFDWEVIGGDSITNERAEIIFYSAGEDNNGTEVYSRLASDFLSEESTSGHFHNTYDLSVSSYQNLKFANRVFVRFNYIPNTVTLKISNFKLEYGQKSTRWCMSTLDMENMFVGLETETEARQDADIALGSRIDALQNEVDTKATASALNALSGKVDEMEDSVQELLEYKEEGMAASVVNVNNNSALSFWTGSQAEYDQIITKSSTTLYIITDA